MKKRTLQPLKFNTYDHLDFPEWPAAQRIYHQSFPKKGRKPDPIISNIFSKRIGYVHTATTTTDDVHATPEQLCNELAAMAITGIIKKPGILLIDYLAVREDMREIGVGSTFVNAIKDWASDAMKLNGIIVEVESDPTPENESRIRFWQRCGFKQTDYVHQYIWVPEPYRAMYVSFDSKPNFPTDGETLFRYISDFHKKCFRPSP